MNHSTDRRRFLRAAAGVGAAVAAAGCSAPLDALRSEESPPGTIGDRNGTPIDDGAVAWPRERFDAANTRFNPDADLLEEPTANRLVDGGTPCLVTGDERLYWYETTVSESSRERFLSCRDANGDEEWSREVHRIGSCPIVTPDVAYAAEGLTAFNAANGDVLWESEVFGSNVTHGGDRLYVDASTELAAVDPETGSVDWRREFHGFTHPQTSIATAGDTVYAFGQNAVVSATDASDGGPEWDRTLDPEAELIGPLVATDERTLVVARRELVALEAATGAVAWRYADDSYHSDPAVPTVAGDRVFLSPTRPEPDLVCLDLETGDERWRREPESEPAPEPPLAVGDGVYYALADGGLLAVSHEGEVRWQSEEHSIDSLHAAAGNRLLVTVSGDYRRPSLYALEG